MRLVLLVMVGVVQLLEGVSSDEVYWEVQVRANSSVKEVLHKSELLDELGAANSACPRFRDLDEAKSFFETTVENYAMLSRLYKSAGEHRYAALMNETAVDVATRFAKIYGHLVRLDAIIEGEPDPHPRYLSDAGFLSRKLCMHDMSLAYFRRSVAKDALAYNNFAAALVEAEDFPQARAAYQKATNRKIPIRTTPRCPVWKILQHPEPSLLIRHNISRDTYVFEYTNGSAFIQGEAGTIIQTIKHSSCNIILGPGQRYLNRFRYEKHFSPLVQGLPVNEVEMKGLWIAATQVSIFSFASFLSFLHTHLYHCYELYCVW